VWKVRLENAYDFNIGNVSGCGIYVSGSGTDYEFFVSAKKTTAAVPYAAIWLDGTIDRILIEGLVAKDCTYDVLRATTTGTNIAIGPVVTNRSNSISADGGGALEPEIGTDTWALGTANAVGAISARHAYRGRVITLIATGGVTVQDVNNLKMAGNFAMTADDALTLRCDGTNWFEMGRSVN
jgi:hypothetical protein